MANRSTAKHGQDKQDFAFGCGFPPRLGVEVAENLNTMAKSYQQGEPVARYLRSRLCSGWFPTVGCAFWTIRS
eukprot:2100185-Lingulodinium_polyedra.AAC.1